jgi:multiple antibiotic resistance protein
MLEKIIRDFMTIWTTVDPITNLALFASLTAGMHRSERRRIAWRASLYAAIVLVVAVVIGQLVLDAMGIRLRSLQIAGGLILFIFGLQMVFGWIEQPGASVEQGRDLEDSCSYRLQSEARQNPRIWVGSARRRHGCSCCVETRILQSIWG